MNVSLHKLALFLDVDGTLLELQDQPDAVVSNPELTRMLERLAAAANGALALVSGRPLAEIDRIFSPKTFCAAGGHGAEIRLPHGETERDPGRMPARIAETLSHKLKDHEGTFVESKSHGLALHYRANPAAASAVRELAEAALNTLKHQGGQFSLLSGKMVYELVPRRVNKGAAVRRLMADPIFEGRRPIFVGDDVTDEYGFTAVNELGGQSLRVGPANGASKATERLSDVAAVHDWLNALLKDK